MYAEMMFVRAPTGRMTDVCQLIEHEYLAVARTRRGFLIAYFIEQEDDPDSGYLIQFWTHKAAMDDFRLATGAPERARRTIKAQLPGIRLKNKCFQVQHAPCRPFSWPEQQAVSGA